MTTTKTTMTKSRTLTKSSRRPAILFDDDYDGDDGVDDVDAVAVAVVVATMIKTLMSWIRRTSLSSKWTK